MSRTLSKEEIERYLSAIANDIGTVDESTIRVNLLVRRNHDELTDDEYKQLLKGMEVKYGIE